MLARVRSSVLNGIDACAVEVEVNGRILTPCLTLPPGLCGSPSRSMEWRRGGQGEEVLFYLFWHLIPDCELSGSCACPHRRERKRGQFQARSQDAPLTGSPRTVNRVPPTKEGSARVSRRG